MAPARFGRTLINPVEQAETFDNADWPFEPIGCSSRSLMASALAGIMAPPTGLSCAIGRCRLQSPTTLTLINPIPRTQPFDHPDLVFEAKFDGFRAEANAINAAGLVSLNGQCP